MATGESHAAVFGAGLAFSAAALGAAFALRPAWSPERPGGGAGLGAPPHQQHGGRGDLETGRGHEHGRGGALLRRGRDPA